MTTTDSVPTIRPTDELRPLGSFENLFDLYTQRLPVQFSVIAELDRVVSADELAAALRQVQAAHPMLTVGVRRGDTDARFWRSARPVPVVVALSGTPWEAIATQDQTWPLDLASAPLARCTLSTSPGSSVIVMTFAHQIADGVSGTAVLRDVVRALNGEAITAREIPPAQEDLLADAASIALTPTIDESAPEAGGAAIPDLLTPADDGVLTRRGTVRPFDKMAPRIESYVWSADLTQRALVAAREQSTTLHALVTSAAVRVLFAGSDRDSIALMNPMNIRRAAHTDDSLALYFLSTRMGFTPAGSEDIWALAREVRVHIRTAQSLTELASSAAGMSAGTSWVATVDDAVEAMVAFANYDLMVTNLGDLGNGPDAAGMAAGGTHIVDLFGPTMATQIDGEQILALSSFDGALRTTITTRNPLRHFLSSIAEEVEAALENRS